MPSIAPDHLQETMRKTGHILIADDDESSREVVEALLSGQGFRVTIARDGQEALDLLSEAHDLVLADLRTPRRDGIGLLKALQARASRPPVIVMSAYATIDSAVEATKEGAYGYIVKPIKGDTLLHLIHRALEERRLQRENAVLRKELEKSYRFHDLIGKSPPMRELFRLIGGIAGSESTILLHGESGTGKELVARAIHSMSPRTEGPFVAVNCGGVPESLLESELFGHVRGAFTGAVAEKKGLFQVAHGGTLFLDEIGETPLRMQVNFLRVLEEGEVRPVGGTQSRHVNVRLIAATNGDLEEAVQARTFRADLFYRLNVIAIPIPPLRERMEDIPLLLEHFLAKYNARLKKQVRTVSPETLALLLDYPWPGNVRELENCIERAVVLSQGEALLPGVLPPSLRFQGKGGQENTRGTLAGVVQQAIVKALIQAKGNRRLAAQILGIPERSLYRKIKAYGLREQSCQSGRIEGMPT
jgi:two-component system response regulator AtoC